MDKKYLIGIDAGTTSIKAVLFDLNGNELFISSVDNEVINTNRTHNEQDMNKLWENVKTCLKDLVNKSNLDPQELGGIGLSAQGEGLWLLDEDNKPFRNAMLWNDGRAADLIQDLKTNHIDLYNKIKLHCASFIKPGSTLTLIKWLKENEKDNYDKTKSILTCKDYIRYNLTGNLNWELTDASCSCLDFYHEDYAYEIFDDLDLSEVKDKLPKLISATEVGGYLKEDLAKEIGLSSDIPVSAGMLDIVATAVGAGATQENSICTILGTTGMNLVTLKEYDADLAVNGWEKHLEKDKFIKGQGMMSAMPNQNWLLQKVFEEELNAELFKKINNEIKDMKPGEGGLLYLPHIDASGERAPFQDSNACAQLMGIKTSTTKYEILHAVLEGICLGIRDCLSFVEGKEAIYLTGGGAKSDILRQMIADTTGREVIICDASELAAKGAALSAGMMSGLIDNLDKQKQFYKIKEVVSPREEYTKKYDELYMAYKMTQEHAKDFWHWRKSFLEGE